MPRVSILTTTRASDWSSSLIDRIKTFDRPLKFDGKPLTYEWVVCDNSSSDKIRNEVLAAEEKGLSVVYYSVGNTELDATLAEISAKNPDPIWLRWHRIVRELPIGAHLNIACREATGDYIIHFQDGQSPVYTPDFLTRNLMALSRHKCYITQCEGQFYSIAYHKAFWSARGFDPLDSNVNSKAFLDGRRDDIEVADVRKIVPTPPPPASETVAIAQRRLATQFSQWSQTHQVVAVASGVAEGFSLPTPTLLIFNQKAEDYVNVLASITAGNRPLLLAINAACSTPDFEELVSLSEYIVCQVADGVIWAIDGNVIGAVGDDTSQMP
jgi:hypothetical protein